MGIFKNMGGNIPGRNFLGRNFAGVIQQGGVGLVKVVQVAVFLIPLRRLNSLMQDKPKLFFIFYNVIWP